MGRQLGSSDQRTYGCVLRQDPERYRRLSERIPAGRWGTPEDLKGVTVFLASAASDYIHGTLIAVDGGWLGY